MGRSLAGAGLLVVTAYPFSKSHLIQPSSSPILSIRPRSAEQCDENREQADDAERVDSLIGRDSVKLRSNVMMNEVERRGINHELERKERQTAQTEGGLLQGGREQDTGNAMEQHRLK